MSCYNILDQMVLEQIKALVGAESVVKGTSLITLYLPAGGNL